MASIKPKRIPGCWRSGFTLDYHTIRSVYLGDDDCGNPQFETHRTELGELLFRLKYRGDMTAVTPIVDRAVEFLSSWKSGANLLVPVPPSRKRPMQPVMVLAEAISKRVGIPCSPRAVYRTRDVREELKDVYDFDERIQLLDGMHAIDVSQIKGCNVLLFDDLYRSGATMNVIVWGHNERDRLGPQ